MITVPADVWMEKRDELLDIADRIDAIFQWCDGTCGTPQLWFALHYARTYVDAAADTANLLATRWEEDPNVP